MEKMEVVSIKAHFERSLFILLVMFSAFSPLIIVAESPFLKEDVNHSFHDFWYHEPQVFQYWSDLTRDQQVALQNQLNQIDLEMLKRQQQVIQELTIIDPEPFEPYTDFSFSGNLNHQLIGQKLIEEGRLGCILLAGGQGTRLRHPGPKGTYPISIIKNKSLFQLCAEKVIAAGKKAGRPLHLAIMTSDENDEETQAFFKEHHFFGLNPAQISFFTQDSFPLLDAEGKVFLKTPFQMNVGADGNGHSLLCFARSGLLDQWMQDGIQYVHVILVDNPLADPFDAELLGFHDQQASEMTLKCTEKVKPEEKVGLLVKQNGGCRVIEYSEIPENKKNEMRSDGHLSYCCANLSLFCFSLSTIKDFVSANRSLPLHKAWKATEYVDNQGHSQLSDGPIAWKFETFIFDWLMHVQKVGALIYPREQCFAPLKNFEGMDSRLTVRDALQQADRKVIQDLTGLPPPDFAFELAADFYYPTATLRAKWKGKQVTTSYVEP